MAGYIDDDPNKRRLRLTTSRVLGSRQDLARRARALGVRRVIIAIPSADPEFLRDLSDELSSGGFALSILPPLRDIVGGRVRLSHVHELDMAEMLGRREMAADLSTVADYLKDRVVLITGAGGSIGSEIARQVHAFQPRELVCLDRDESALHALQLSIYGQGLLNSSDMVLCDIRDSAALAEVFAGHAPDVVFHAAALKHLPMLEQYPDEGWKTNVIGTYNILEKAAECGVKVFVNISTDKAADPTSVLGKTKRVAEELTAWFASAGHGRLVSVRFGNVLGSRGSVLYTFMEQIKRGGPVTVVSPEITRYFMTIPEACQLVLQAGAIGEPGDVLVLDMGAPVKILDVAQRLIERSGANVDIEYTGLRAGEKLHETLFGADEQVRGTGHPLISRVRVPALSPEAMDELFGSGGRIASAGRPEGGRGARGDRA